ncbi:MAG: S9 family peptidase [Sphingomonadales bacterium]
MLRIILTLFVIIFWSLSTFALEDDFSLEQVMSAPLPSNITAAPSGGKIAWVQNSQGLRNIWVAELPDYKGRQLTSYTEDDGQEITNINWSPDAKFILYVRGGAPNRQGTYPNPTNDPAGAIRAIWSISLDFGKPERIAEGTAPLISPRGDTVAFVNKGQVYATSLSGTPNPKLLIKARGNNGSLRWSPSGNRLAFVSNRGDHSFVGVYDLKEKTVNFLRPGVDLDKNPVWSPDGRQIAFTREPTTTDLTMFRPRREGYPWSILIADTVSGETQTLWQADKGHGSVFHNVVASNQIMWGADNLIVFPWEKDGWSHLYTISSSGGRPRLLTPGNFEVDNVILSPDRSTVIFSSNQNDIDRRHIWSVPVDGTRPKALTSGNNIETMPIMTSDGKSIAFFASGPKKAAHAAIIIGSGSPRALAANSIPKDFPEKLLTIPEQVIFSGSDGMRIHGQLFLPTDMEPNEHYPAILFFHGGSRRQMLLGWHYLGYYNGAYAMNQFMANQGYIVLSVNYRSGTGYGMEFREAINYGATGASEFNDVMGAGLYLQNRPDVDPSRIGLWGGSYGGYLTALGLARASDLFAAGVDIHGVHDWNDGIQNFKPGYDPKDYPNEAQLAFESSPKAWLDGWRSPVLMVHGDDDRNVQFKETVTLIEELRKRDVQTETLVFPDEVHGFLLHRNWLATFKTSSDFFDRRLKNIKGLKPMF